MSQRLRILHLEDEPDYSQLVRDLLAHEGIEAQIRLVTDAEAFQRALTEEQFDLILADYTLPGVTGAGALEVARKLAPSTPFLLISGTVGEQTAIETLRAGATDYVLKQTPERLVPAVRRAVEEARERERRRKAETELGRREKYFRAVTENALDIISLLDERGVFKFNSPSVRRVLGYDPQELIGQSAFALCHPEDRARVMAAFQYGLAHPGETVRVEFRIRHRDGSWVHLESVGQNRLADPDINAAVVNSRDITDRKRAEHRLAVLAELGRKLNAVTEPLQAAELIRDAAEKLFRWDAFVLDLLTPGRQRMVPLLSVDTHDGKRVVVNAAGEPHPISPMSREILEHGARRIVRESQEPVPDTHPFGDRARRSAALLYAPLPGRTEPVGILSVQSYTPDAYGPQDLETLQVLADYCGGALERIRAVTSLRESEAQFRALFENSPDAIIVADAAARVLDANPRACQLHGLGRDQMLGQFVTALVPPERANHARQSFQRLLSGELSRVEGEAQTADGRRIPVSIRAVQIEYRNQPAVLMHLRDITERKQAEASLRRSEAMFRAVWENAVDGMRLTDADGYIVAVNAAYCRLVGMSRAQLEGNLLTVIGGDAETGLENYRRAFQERRRVDGAERRLTLANGNTLVVEESVSFVELPGQPLLQLSVFRDVTGERRLEEQLRQSQKMQAIGQLASGVAHDFNNILTIIQGHASLLLSAGGLSEPATRSAQQIVQASERAASLTRQLLTFSRRQVLQPRPVDLNEVVANLTRMLDRLLGEDIALEVVPAPGRAVVRADSAMMEQVLLNLAVNARDAMPRGGRLRIRLTRENIAPPPAPGKSARGVGPFVCLTVTDTGCGIAPEILPRIFEPFFTTKEVGKGTGLGLATVYGIVQQHGGWIEVESQLGRGSTFRIYLPEADGDTASDAGESPARETARGRETILVVEDEPAVRELVRDLLTQHGYRVLEAESGPRALEIWRQHKQEIALLLTDVVMPEAMNGRELAERLCAERPGLKVIFTSGYSADVLGREHLLERGIHYVQKPFHPQRLVQIVRDCLDGRLGQSPEPFRADSVGRATVGPN
jgi:two-component system cell cycle sensor histidine kinase/response regulator CckA